jgi:DNA-binding transcriptional regulator YhcF (GntR family)/methanogenic corrinoid protein MtbC1
MHLDKEHPRPVYLQLKEMLQSQIEQGIYLSHQKLPSERDLCQHHNLSRMTARRALKELIDEGLAYTRIGKGTFVSPHLAKRAAKDKIIFPNGSASENGIPGNHYYQKLVEALLSFDCIGIEQAISEILAVYSLEIVASKLFLTIIRDFEQQWLKGEISLLAHNYAITTLRSQLIGMMNAATMLSNGSRVMLACAPGDQHEIGLISLALSLRRRGFVVIYFGPNLTLDEFHQIIEKSRPRLICMSACTTQSVENLVKLTQRYQEKLQVETDYLKSNKEKPLFAFGGVAFKQNPELVSKVSGLYLGDTIENAVIKVQELFAV